MIIPMSKKAKNALPEGETPEFYNIRTKVSWPCYLALVDEQTERQQSHPQRKKTPLMDIAAEWLEQAAATRNMQREAPAA